MAKRSDSMFRVWMILLMLLLAAGIALLAFGLREYRRDVRLPRHAVTAFTHCNQQKFVA